jgi:phasin family protein
MGPEREVTMADEVTKAETAQAAAPVSKIDAATEKAYAEAAAKAAPAAKPVPAEKPAAPAAQPVAKAAPSPKKAVAAKKPVATTKVAAKVKKLVTKPARKPVARPVAAPVAAKAATPAKSAFAPATTITKLKDKIMETANTTDFTAAAKGVAADLQTRVQGAYAKTAELASEAADFSKGNVEAVVESGKIFFTGAQELVKDNVETGKTVIETVTADAKKMMEVKSPTELMQMQGELARRNFDAIVSFGSKRTEAWLKLYNEAFAPISNRVSIAAEKITKAA